VKNSPVVTLSLPRKPLFPTWLLRLQPVLCFLQNDRFMYVAVCFCALTAVRGGVIARERGRFPRQEGAVRESQGARPSFRSPMIPAHIVSGAAQSC
jgi:hypothetical protein